MLTPTTNLVIFQNYSYSPMLQLCVNLPHQSTRLLQYPLFTRSKCPDFGMPAPELCPNGTYSLPGWVSCLVCEAGTFSLAEGEGCQACPVGWYCNGIDDPRECAEGTYGPVEGLNICEVCPPGLYANETGRFAVSCRVSYAALILGYIPCLL